MIKSEMKTIYSIYNKDISKLKEEPLNDLMDYFGDEDNTNLIKEVYELHDCFKEVNNSSSYEIITELFEKESIARDAFSMILIAFSYNYFNNKNLRESEKIDLSNHIQSANVHINRLQHELFDLSCYIQRIENNKSFFWAKVAIGVSIVCSLASLICSLWLDMKHDRETVPKEIPVIASPCPNNNIDGKPDKGTRVVPFVP